MSKRIPHVRSRSRERNRVTVGAVCSAMERIAPPALAQEWDNVGLIAGDTQSGVRRVLLCIDLTAAVAKEAIRRRADLVLAYHPPIFKPIATLRAQGGGAEAAVFWCVRDGIAVYATHTALDAVDGGTNDVLAGLCGLGATQPLEWVDDPQNRECKLAVFVPRAHLEKVSGAVFGAGAGRIGEYERCSFRQEGQGTFLGGENTHPTIGERGQLETVEEVRLETVVPVTRLPEVVAALRGAHPYEEPAFDIYPLKGRPIRGIGRVGSFPRPIKLFELAASLKRGIGAAPVQVVGERGQRVKRAVIVAGAAGSLPFRVGLGGGDVVVTGEIRHHDALAIARCGAAAVALGHWASERPVLAPLAQRLGAALPGVRCTVSGADGDPFQFI